ncbi:DUF239 domain-containing protein [Solihabitans fulvus]|uniref:DUF239 domain-containing protein n=1 Tax=Solihabitans fulvus TaxID=1892852 RepID=A0A5B2WKT8_9PSEU|nr:neprosin family prolyl endopeptidase [Solihabitans fulvus]KAA2252421.1 DUF239 domain-containing protein [Solihabitans fulvus]
MSLRRNTSTPKSLLAAAAIAVATTAATLLLPAGDANAATCWFGSCYSYVTGRQHTTTSGAGVTMYQAAPANVSANGHSLQELALQNTNSTTTADTVEIGWTIDPGTYGDYQTHLFVFFWINGQPQCYNAGCGFVQVSSTVTAGMTLTPGTYGSFALRNYNGDWWAYYNNVPFGYFPGSEWGGAFTTAHTVSAFGEVSAPSQPSCTQMGDGVFGSQSGASSISNYQLYGSSSQPYFAVTATDPSYYDAGSATPTSFRLGGPGGC